MIIDAPRDTEQLRLLWKQAFHDPDDFLDAFFCQGFSADRCRCVYVDGALAAALYWFDCSWENKPLAYLYAVATDVAFQRKGYCRALMEDTHRHLQKAGYHGCILVPRTPALFAMYGKMGYTTCCHVEEFSCPAHPVKAQLRQLSPAEYAALRRQALPEGGVLQEGATVSVLASYCSFYAGNELLAAAYGENGQLTVCELLGNTADAGGIAAALGYPTGKFRVPGGEKPFAMYRCFCNDPRKPSYFGLALD